MASRGSILPAGSALMPGDFLLSPNGSFMALMQNDANFVLYHTVQSSPTPAGEAPYWSLQMAPGGAAYVRLRTDGVLAAYHGTDPSVENPDEEYWSSGDPTYPDSCLLSLEDDGNLVLRTGTDVTVPGETRWSALPSVSAQCKFMQNYRQVQPVNGGPDVLAIRDGAGLELFTIGQQGDIYSFFPDPGNAGETGYGQKKIVTGLNATTLAGALDANGGIVLFAGSGQTVWAIPKNADGTYGPAVNQLAMLADVVGLTARTIDGTLILAITQKEGGNFRVSSLRYGQDFKPYVYTFASTDDPLTVILGTTAAAAQLACVMDGKLELLTMPNPTATETSVVLSPALRPIGIDSAVDASGEEQIIAILEDNRPYRLVRDPDQNGVAHYHWDPDWLLVPPTVNQVAVPFSDVVLESDRNGGVHAFLVSGPVVAVPGDPTVSNLLYHVPPTQSATIPPLSIHKSTGLRLAGVANDGGCIDLFSVEGGHAVRHLYQEQTDGDWVTQTVLDGTNPPEEFASFASYATDLTIYDGAGAPVNTLDQQPDLQQFVTIRASDRSRVEINGLVYFLDANHGAAVWPDHAGRLTITQETVSLASPSLVVLLPSSLISPNAPQLVIEPYVDVQTQLADSSAQDLLDAEVVDDSGGTTPLLAEPYRSDGTTAESLSLALATFMGDGEGSGTLNATASPRDRFWSRQVLPPGGDLRRINARGRRRACRITFHANGPVVYESITPERAAELRAEAMATLPAVSASATGSIWDSIADLARSIYDGIAQVGQIIYDGLTAVVQVIVDGIEYVFNTVVQLVQEAFDMIEVIFAHVKAFFEDLYRWLALIFEWTSIQRTQDTIAHMITTTLGFLAGSVTQLRSLVDAGFGSITDQFDALIDQLIAGQVGNSVSIGGYEQSNTPVNLDADRSVSNNFLFNEYMRNGGNETPGATAFALQARAAVDPLATLLVQLVSTVESDPSWSTAVTYFTNLGGSPDQVFSQLLAGLLNVVKGVVHAGLALANSIVDALLDLLVGVINTANSMLTSGVSIPFVSAFYSWITFGTKSLRLLDLISLIAAVPSTLMYKAATGKAPFPNATGPGSPEDITGPITVASMLQASGLGSPTAGSTPAITLSPMAVQSLAGSYVACQFISVMISTYTDVVPLPPDSASGLLPKAGLFFTVAAIGVQFPWFFSTGTLDCLTTTGAEYWVYMGMCVTTSLALYLDQIGLGLPSIPNDVSAIAFTMCGATMLAITALYAGDEPNEKRVTNAIVSKIPMASKLLRHSAVSAASLQTSPFVLGAIEGLCGWTSTVLGYQLLLEGNQQPAT